MTQIGILNFSRVELQIEYQPVLASGCWGCWACLGCWGHLLRYGVELMDWNELHGVKLGQTLYAAGTPKLWTGRIRLYRFQSLQTNTHLSILWDLQDLQSYASLSFKKINYVNPSIPKHQKMSLSFEILWNFYFREDRPQKNWELSTLLAPTSDLSRSISAFPYWKIEHL